MARPKKQPGEKRSETLTLRLTLAEHEYVRSQAGAAGLSVSAFLRRRALGLAVQPARSRGDAALINEVNRLGVNVNQLARAQHTDRRFAGDWQVIAEECRRVLAKVVAACGP